MPSHRIHLAIANDINKTLKMNNNEIMVGSVLPDLAIINHKDSHFQNGLEGIKGTANPDLFIKNNDDVGSNAIKLGFLLHILTDKFYNSYFFEKYYIYNKNNTPIALRNYNNETKLTSNEIKKLKQCEFSYYDKYLMVNKKVPEFLDINCINKVSNFNNIEFDKNSLEKYILKANDDVKKYNKFNYFRKKFYIPKFQISSLSEMEELYNKCLEYILEYLKKLSI